MTESNLPPQAPSPEQNLLRQTRTWTDLFPWLRLARVLRVAGGPVWITHAFLTSLIWLAGMAFARQGSPSEALYQPPRRLFSAWVVGTSPGDFLTSPLWPDSLLSLEFGWGVIMWTSLLWLPTSMLFIRAGAVLTSGREMPSYLSTLRLVFKRLWAGLLILLLPLLCTLPFLILIWGITGLLAWLGSMFGDSVSRAVPLLSAVVVMPLGLISGLLLAAGKFAVPLGLANLMTMAEADPMDSLSRGYEYTLRRLPQLLAYCLIAIVLGGIVVAGWTAIGSAAEQVMSVAGQELAASTTAVGLMLASIPIVLAWSMIGGIFLLLRQSAGGQEVEDIWAEPDVIVAPKMPKVEREQSAT